MKISADWLEDAQVQSVLRALMASGHQAYFVGGCVRDALLHRPSTDIDVATDATPDEVTDCVEAHGLRAIPTGLAHGTITVVSGDQVVEVTTFRRDVATDGRRAVVAFAKSLVEDAARRDFTINALYADSSGEISDPVGGLKDLQTGKLRFIGNPMARIREDYLRILRFFRFTAWFADAEEGIDAEALAACAAGVEGLETLSAERIGQEMLKLLSAPDPALAASAMDASGALIRVLPGASATAIAPLVHLETVVSAEADPIRRLAVMGGDAPSERLRLSNANARRLERMTDATVDPSEVAYRHGFGVAVDQLLVHSALLGKPVQPETVAHLRSASEQVLPISAQDFMPRHSGRALGDILREAEARWIASGFELTRDELLR